MRSWTAPRPGPGSCGAWRSRRTSSRSCSAPRSASPGRPTVAFFDISKTNAIVPSLVNPLFVTQVGELKVQGVEVEVAARPVDPWRLIASFTYLNAYISQDTNQLLVGNQLQGVPAYEASLWTSYNFGTEERGFTVGGGVFYSSDRPTSNANNLYIPAYTRLDLFTN